MPQRSKFLKVVSIILIVLGAINVFSNVIGLVMKGAIETTLESVGMAAPSTFTYVLALAGSLIILISGIMGVLYKSKKSVLVMVIIFAAYQIINIIFGIVTTGFTALSLIGLIWPLLYFWGWYQSN